MKYYFYDDRYKVKLNVVKNNVCSMWDNPSGCGGILKKHILKEMGIPLVVLYHLPI